MMDELGGVCGSMEDRRNAYWGFVRERDGQRSLRRSRIRWKDIKLVMKAIGWKVWTGQGKEPGFCERRNGTLRGQCLDQLRNS